MSANSLFRWLILSLCIYASFRASSDKETEITIDSSDSKLQLSIGNFLHHAACKYISRFSWLSELFTNQSSEDPELHSI